MELDWFFYRDEARREKEFPFLSGNFPLEEVKLHIKDNLSLRDYEKVWYPRIQIIHTGFIELNKFEIIKKYGLSRKNMKPSLTQDIIWQGQYGLTIDVNIFDTVEKIKNFAGHRFSNLELRYGFPHDLYVHSTFTQKHLNEIIKLIGEKAKFYMQMYKGDITRSHLFANDCLKGYLLDTGFCIYSSIPRNDEDHNWQDWLEYHEQTAIVKKSDKEKAHKLPNMPRSLQ